MTQDVPTWLRALADTGRCGSNPWLRLDPGLRPDAPSRRRRWGLRRGPAGTQRWRPAAVLVLFGGAPAADPAAAGELPPDATVLLTQRATTLRSHGGQVAFPGGAIEPGDSGPVAAALREAQEETGLDPDGVQVLSVLPSVAVPVSGFDVTPVVAYWRTPGVVGVVSEAEATRVAQVPLAQLLDPVNRFVVRHPLGYQSPAFTVADMLVWGFTAWVLAGLLAASEWELDWDRHDVRDLRSSLAAVGMSL